MLNLTLFVKAITFSKFDGFNMGELTGTNNAQS